MDVGTANLVQHHFHRGKARRISAVGHFPGEELQLMLFHAQVLICVGSCSYGPLGLNTHCVARQNLQTQDIDMDDDGQPAPDPALAPDPNHPLAPLDTALGSRGCSAEHTGAELEGEHPARLSSHERK